MGALNRARRRWLAFACVLVLAAVPPAVGQIASRPSGEDAVLRGFLDRVGAYANLHHEIEMSLPRPEGTGNMVAILFARRQLAAAIRAARPLAHEGDIFTPAARGVFRRLIAEAFAGRDIPALLENLEEQVPLRNVHPRVHDRYPSGMTHEVPAALLARFPDLPEDVEYRIVHYDLVLWDIHADLIVDVFRDAFAPLSTTD